MQRTTLKRKAAVQPRFWLLLFGVCALLLLISYVRSAKLYQSQLALANEVRQELNEAALENAQLKRSLAFMQSEQYVERQARREYGMIVPGDIRFVADVSGYSGVVAAWNSEQSTTQSSPFTAKPQ